MSCQGFGDAVVADGFIGPATLLGVVAQDGDVSELAGEHVVAVGVGDVVVALFADVRVAARPGDGVTRAETVGDSGLERLGVQPVDLGRDRRAGSGGMTNSGRRPLTLVMAVS